MRLLKVALPGAGLLFLGFLIGRIGPSEIFDNIALMKWSFPAILLLALCWHVTNSIAWSFAFPSRAFRPRLQTLFMSKLAGDAVSQLTPLANIGGEPLKAFLMAGESPASRGLASVVVNKTGQIITGLFFTSIGFSLVLFYWNLPRALPLSVQLGLGFLIGFGVLFIILVYRKQKRMFSALMELLRRLHVRTEPLERKIAKAVRIDESISLIYSQHKGRFFLVMAFHSAGWLLGAVETYFILHALGADVEFPVAFLITSLTLIINSLFFFMPSNIGVLEGGQVFLLATLGLDPALGLSLGIIKRMRKIFWISIGWLFLTRMSRASWQEQSLSIQTSPPHPLTKRL